MTTVRVIEGKPTTVDETGEPTPTPQPKVAASALAMLGLVVIVAVLGAVTPDMLTFAGPFSPLVYAAVVAAGGFIAAYVKRP